MSLPNRPRRRLALAVLLPLATLVASGVVPQERGGKKEEDAEKAEPADPKIDPARDIFGRLRKSDGRATGSRYGGCWQLVDVQVAGFPSLGREGDGALLIGNEFLSMELHLTWPENENNLIDVHQTFIGEYSLSGTGELDVTTVIGSFIDDATGDLEWERGGFPRSYRVREADGLLTLEFGQNDVLTFSRRRSTGDRSRDVFGRPSREGRPRKRDIFGRPVQPDDGY